MKEKEARAHMLSAYNYADLSYCIRKKVGCVIVKDNRIISIGYNGTPPGWDNCCETEDGKSKPEVIHAELNAIGKLAKSTESGKGASVFVTCEPCIECAVLISVSGIAEVYYAEKYVGSKSSERGMEGVEYLERCNIPVHFWSVKQ